MDDSDGGLSFDFEPNLDSAVPTVPSAAAAPTATTTPTPLSAADPSAASDPTATAPPTGFGRGRSFRQTVCRHWLRGLCMKGDNCGFLHQYDKARMPICRFFRLYGECREQDCVYKHTNEDIKECNMYKLGFCPNGPDCRYRHAKQPGPPPPVEEVLQKIQHLYNYNNYGGPNKYFQQRNAGFAQQNGNSQPPQGPNTNFQAGSTTESLNVQPQQPVQQPEQVNQIQTQNFPNSNPDQANRTATPLPQGPTRCVGVLRF